MAVPRRSGTGSIGRARPFPADGTGIEYGEQVENRGREASAEVLHADGASLHALRTAPRRLPQVRHVPDLLPETGRSRPHSGRPKGQLVNGQRR